MQIILEEKEYKRLKDIEEFMDSQDKCYIHRIHYYGNGSSYYVLSKTEVVNEYTKSLEDKNESLRNIIDKLSCEANKTKPKKWYQKIF